MLNAVDGTAERRQHPRLNARIPLQYEVLGRMRSSRRADLRDRSQTRDLSAGGTSFDAVIDDPQLASALEQQKKVLKLHLALTEEAEDFETRAGVAWIYPLKAHSSKSAFALGTSFFGMSEAASEELSSYLARYADRRRKEALEARQKVFKILSKIARVTSGSFSEATLIREGLGFDSLMAVEALAAFETVFDIEIDETRAFELRTVGDILSLVDEYSLQRRSPPFAVSVL